MPEDTITGMSWVSSSPRTRLASTSECVRKMTTVSATVLHLQQDHRHVVVRIRLADEGLHLAQDALAQLLRGELGVLLDQAAEPIFAEQIHLRVHRLRDPV